VPHTFDPMIAARLLTFGKFSAASAVATAVSQLVLVGYWLGDADALAAGVAAFVAGAVPQYLIVRYWVWGGPIRRPELRRRLLIFVVVTTAGGVAAIGTTALVEGTLGALIDNRAQEALLLNAAYLLGGAPVFLAKFAILDRAYTPASPSPARQIPALPAC
jgi:putative flippase GtrA